MLLKLPFTRGRLHEPDLGQMVAEIDYGVDCAGGEPQRRTVAPLSFGVTLAALLVQGDGIAAALRRVEETFVVQG